LREGKNVGGKVGLLTPLIIKSTEPVLQTELEVHIDQNNFPNHKSGSNGKTQKSASDEFELNTPRGWSCTFAPYIVKKNQTHLASLTILPSILETLKTFRKYLASTQLDIFLHIFLVPQLPKSVAL
jgi:hypothetical protein